MIAEEAAANFFSRQDYPNCTFVAKAGSCFQLMVQARQVLKQLVAGVTELLFTSSCTFAWQTP
jgi:hypothetical protein